MTALDVRLQLSIMMAGVYAIQGAWWPLLAVHLQDLGVPGRARSWIFATLALSSLLSPLSAGQLADRRMPAQRLLALIYAIGGGLLLLIGSGLVKGPAWLFAAFLAYWLVTAPAFGLASTIALRNLDRPATQFGGVRMWGTVGWMAIGWVVSSVMTASGSNGAGHGAFEAFGVAATVSALMAIYVLTLPRTNPMPSADGTSPGLALTDVGELLRRPWVALLLPLAFGVCLTTPFVYQVVPNYLQTLGLQRSLIAVAMSFGQIPEILSLLVLPRILSRLGYRGSMGLGILAWVVYFGVMASHPPLALVLCAVPIQGVAIALFHIPCLMFLDTHAPSNRRATAQSLYVMATSGLGSLFGSLMAGEIVNRSGGVGSSVFVIPFVIDLLLLAWLALAFRPSRSEPSNVARSGSRHAIESNYAPPSNARVANRDRSATRVSSKSVRS